MQARNPAPSNACYVPVRVVTGLGSGEEGSEPQLRGVRPFGAASSRLLAFLVHLGLSLATGFDIPRSLTARRAFQLPLLWRMGARLAHGALVVSRYAGSQTHRGLTQVWKHSSGT